MTKLQPIGSIPSPYGTMMAVYFDASRSDKPDDCYFHDLDGCMDLAGVYGGNREQCRAALTEALGIGGLRFDIFLAHGGQKVPRVPITAPRKAIYTTLPAASTDIPIENWITLGMEQPDWSQRAAVLLGVIGDNLENSRDWNLPEGFQAQALRLLLTATLEHVGDREIDCLEAAALYALTEHDEWIAAGLKWLQPVKETWLADWISDRPVYAAFATACRKLDRNLPLWIGGANG